MKQPFKYKVLRSQILLWNAYVKFTVIPWWAPLKTSGTLGNADILRHQNFQQKWLFHTPCHQELIPLYVEIIFAQGNSPLKKIIVASTSGAPQLTKKGPKSPKDLTDYNGLGGLHNLWLLHWNVWPNVLVMNIVVKQ